MLVKMHIIYVYAELYVFTYFGLLAGIPSTCRLLRGCAMTESPPVVLLMEEIQRSPVEVGSLSP